MLKILHTADIHLGATLIKLGEKKDDQRIQIQKTFENIVKLAIEKQVDLFLIAGDLFDESKPDKGLVDFALSCFAQLNDRHIYTCISLGTHDFLQSGSVFADLDVSSLPYIKIFNDQASNAITIDELSTIVYCNCALSNKSSASPLDGIIRNDQYKYNIAIAHGSVQIPGK